MTDLTAASTLAVVHEIDPTTGEPRVAHIIAPRSADGHAVDLVMESRVYGTPLEAICGATFVASRDPKRFPLCSRCREVREQLRPDEDPTEIPS